MSLNYLHKKIGREIPNFNFCCDKMYVNLDLLSTELSSRSRELSWEFILFWKIWCNTPIKDLEKSLKSNWLPELIKKKSYYMNFKHKDYELYAFVTYKTSLNSCSMTCFFYKIGLNILIWKISPSLFFLPKSSKFNTRKLIISASWHSSPNSSGVYIIDTPHSSFLPFFLFPHSYL